MLALIAYLYLALIIHRKMSINPVELRKAARDFTWKNFLMLLLVRREVPG